MDELRARVWRVTPVLTQVSDPCWYRYQVMHVDEPMPETLVVTVRGPTGAIHQERCSEEYL